MTRITRIERIVFVSCNPHYPWVNIMKATFKIWRGDAKGGEFRDYTDRRCRGHGCARRDS